MKITTAAALAVFVLTCPALTPAAPARAAEAIGKEALATGDYCHMKFPAIRERTLSSDHPVLKDPSEGDIIDFYGPCAHDPLGKEEVKEQLLQLQHRRARNYMD